jgi:hypothetical protein
MVKCTIDTPGGAIQTIPTLGDRLTGRVPSVTQLNGFINLLTTTHTNSMSNDNVTINMLRYDGLYKTDAGEGMVYLRFFEHGAVLCMGATYASALLTVFHHMEIQTSKNENVSVGEYRVNENEIDFTATGINVVEYSGMLGKNNTLHLRVHNHTGNSNFLCKFDFVRLVQWGSEFVTVCPELDTESEKTKQVS